MIFNFVIYVDPVAGISCSVLQRLEINQGGKKRRGERKIKKIFQPNAARGISTVDNIIQKK